MRYLIIKIFSIICAIFIISAPAFSDGYIDREVYKVEDLTSFRLLTKQFQADFDQKRGTKEAEDAYLEIFEYYIDFVNEQNKKIPIHKLFTGIDNEFLKYQYSLYFLGLVMWVDEGECFYNSSNKYIYENFAPYLSKEWQELMKHNVKFAQRMTANGRYVISKSKIKKLIKFYKNFSKKYPEFSEKHGIYETIKDYEEDLKHYPYL